MKLNDELIEKYLNRELSAKDSAEVLRTLMQSPEEYKGYLALVSVHNILNKLTGEELSPAFTSNVMNRIGALRSKSVTDRYFIFGISGVFIFLCVAIAVFIGWQVLSGSDGNGTAWIYNSTAEGIDFLVNILGNIKSSTVLTIIGSVFSLGILITAYFFFENQKNPARAK